MARIETFQLGTDFVKWVSVIAHNQVHRFRRQQKRVGPQLSDLAVDMLAEDAVERADLLESRRDALDVAWKNCRIRIDNWCALAMRDARTNFKTAAEDLGRPVNTVYKALNRIRKTLYECIERTISVEGLTDDRAMRRANLLRLVGAMCNGTITRRRSGVELDAVDE